MKQHTKTVSKQNHKWKKHSMQNPRIKNSEEISSHGKDNQQQASNTSAKDATMVLSLNRDDGRKKQNLSNCDLQVRRNSYISITRLSLENSGTWYYRDSTKVMESVNELAQIMKDLSVLVIDQGTIVDRIDHNIQNVVVSVEERGEWVSG